MDNFISARYGEILAGADATNASAGVRQDLVDENMSTSMALGGDWDDEIYQSKMADQQYNYNLYMEDNETNKGIAAAEYNSVERFAETQARCAGNYRA